MFRGGSALRGKNACKYLISSKETCFPARPAFYLVVVVAKDDDNNNNKCSIQYFINFYCRFSCSSSAILIDLACSGAGPIDSSCRDGPLKLGTSTCLHILSSAPINTFYFMSSAQRPHRPPLDPSTGDQYCLELLFVLLKLFFEAKCKQEPS